MFSSMNSSEVELGNYKMERVYDEEYHPNNNDDMCVSAATIADNNDCDATLIDLVKGYPNLYAKNDKDFKNQNMREQSWMEIATVINWSVEDTQRRWLRLRERFAKERKLRDKEAKNQFSSTNRRKFSFFENMSFLMDHVQTRRTYTNMPIVPQAQSTPKISLVSISSENSAGSSNARQAQPQSQIPPTSLEGGLSLASLSANSPSLRILDPSRYSNNENSVVPRSDSASSMREFDVATDDKNLSTTDSPVWQSEESTNDISGENMEESIGKERAKRKRVDDSLETAFINYTEKLSALLREPQTRPLAEHEESSFGTWISDELRKMPLDMRMKKKMEIASIIFRP